MATPYEVDLQVTIRPIWHQEPPLVKVSCHGTCHETLMLQEQTFDFRYQDTGPGRLTVEFANKTDADVLTHRGLDKMIVIKAVSFFGIQDPRFVWRGQYRPVYPEPWASEQAAAGQTIPAVLTDIDTLGWNGVWTLDFDLPVFTWIHHIQNLGWIYR